jgi:hypothetical protein
MLGPSPYKKPNPKSKDAAPPQPSIDGISVPETLKIDDSELLSLAETPEVSVPSTYDDALRNDELLENIDLIDEEALEVFPSQGSKEEIAFGAPIPEEVDTNAFGGNIGTAPTPTTETQPTSPLSVDERAVLLQNSVVVANAGTTGDVGASYELGTKLVGVPESQQRLQQILSTTVDLSTPDTEIVQIEEFEFPAPLDTIDGGEF